MSPRIQSGEELIRNLRPHPLAFYHLYLIWMYLTGVGLVFMTGIQIEFRQASPELVTSIVWWLVIVLPAVVVALFRINWRWLLALILPGLAAFFSPGMIAPYISLDQNQLLVFFGLLGILGTEMHRRSHRYYITNWRLIMESGHLGVHRRTLLYKNINDLIVEQSLLGRIFNFGSINPITASGLGLGDDFSMVGGAVGVGVSLGAGGGKTVSTPRSRSYHQLMGVPDPEGIHDQIISLMHGQT